MQAGGGWFLPWTMGLQKFAVALPMGGVVPLVPPLLAALPPAPPPLRLIAPPQLPHQQPGRKGEKDSGKNCILSCEKRKADDTDINKDLKKAKLETKALKAKRPGFTDDRYNETSYYIENGLRKVYPYYFTFTTFTKGRWVGEKILDVFAREFRAHPAAEYERCIRAGTLTVNYERVDPDYRLKHNDLLANVVHRHEVPVTSQPITLVHIDEDIVVVNKPASIPVHPCGRYRHNTVVFILAKEYNLKNLRTIHRLDRLTSGLLLFGRSPKKARQMEHQIRNRQVQKEYVCRVDGEFPDEEIECQEPIEVVSYKIGVCKVSAKGKDCSTVFKRLGYNAASNTSVVLCKPKTGRMHQIRVHLQYLGYPVVNDPLYNHPVFGPLRGKGGDTGGKSDEQLVRDLIAIHNAENWLGVDAADDDLLFSKPVSDDKVGEDDCDTGPASRESSPRLESPAPGVTPSSIMTPTLPSPSSGAEAPSEVNSPVCTLAPSPVASPSFNEDSNDAKSDKVTVATQTGCTPAATSQASGLASSSASGSTDALSSDPHCYECRVRYRDPRPRDLVMYLHAWKYKGPGWEYETELPQWASIDWDEPESS
ncbi:RNA pseudouridylate synthase domain-containing protein 2-like isoform X3 [Spodoptera litura]|uniref:Pseudouridylate synthase RPUSD2 n=1 Tax=Spodoptera litura TaxID=69820 RepID=A0A9J7DXI9_SPOLT|nr:RNA pseudouridylate synthase domain-containing protein 2-like isoform X3 [Spodoptera litura]XP_022820381.1 RNA pseudouridylate synthase domain-containing protein 2-like isoform X3 [Spodoptera litura]XP_022820382.1 RNA pseudouridylate synthase domain-containing protein 2-like isoform X3 [Spodoptera litura]XP_022820383.1 RNA pseudouridylate synthase domain-containing protein 2-like isoform X3 [Spodoptera litura]